MEYIARFVPSGESLYERRGKIGGFIAGVGLTLAMGVFASVLATGHPIDLGAPAPVQVYSNF